MSRSSDVAFRAAVICLSLVVVFGVVAGLLLRFGGRDEAPVEGAARPAAGSAGPAAELAAVARPDEPRPAPARSAAEEREAPTARPSRTPVRSPEAAAPEKADLTETRPFHLRVVSQDGVGVADAEVRIHGLRSRSKPGTWFGYRGGVEPTARTNRDGEATLEHWAWADQDGRVSGVDLLVEHPAFVPFRDSSLDLGERQKRYVVRLKHGSTVVVSAWLGSSDNRIGDIKVRVDRESRLGSSDWEVLADGSRQTSQLTPGPHSLRVSHESEVHGLLFSEVHAFELAAGDWQAFHLELHPAEVLAGSLHDDVPRPVRDGHVQLCLRHGGLRHDEPTLRTKHEAPIAPDGSFVLTGLPRGSGQLFALCEGWVSRRTLAERPEEAGISVSGERTPQQIAELLKGAGDRALTHQKVALPAAAPPVILMEATATLRIRIVADDGQPLPGATGGASPNVHYPGVGSTLVPWRTWTAPADAAGVAVLRDLPPEPEVWVHAGHPDYEMARTDRKHRVGAPLRSGEVTEVTVNLVPKGD
ncbi:MAG: hypothetical protein AAF682_10885 [Planctomycetota bacterium]